MKKLLLASTIAQLAVMTPVAVGDDIQLEMSYPNIDAVPEAFRALYTEGEGGAAVLSRVVGIKTQADVNNVTTALTHERTNHKTTKETLNSILAGREPADVLALLDSIPALEAAAAGGTNVDEQVQAKLNQHVAPIQRNLETVTGERDQLLQTIVQLQTKERVRLVGDAVQEAAINNKMLSEAVPDVKFMAQSIFETNENGDVVAKDGIPGVTPGITPEVWLTELKRTKPFYWPASQNAGGRGGQGGHGGDNPWTKEAWNLTEQGRILREDAKKAHQLAAQAGTSVGGAKPA